MVFAAGVLVGVMICVLVRNREFFKRRASVWLACSIVVLVAALGLFSFGLKCGSGVRLLGESGDGAVFTVNILRDLRKGEANTAIRRLEYHLDSILATHSLCLKYALLPVPHRADLLQSLRQRMPDVVQYRKEYPIHNTALEMRQLTERALTAYSNNDAQQTSGGDSSTRAGAGLEPPQK